MAGATHLDNGRFIDRRALDKGPPASRLVSSSLDAGWTSIFVALYESAGASERFEKPVTDDCTLFVTLRGRYALRADRAGKLTTVVRYPGTIGITPPGGSATLQWRAIGGPFESLHVHVPSKIVRHATQEYRRSGLRLRGTPFEHAALDDPVVARVSQSILRAAASGAPELYAESAAHFLVRHLLGFSSLASDDAPRQGEVSHRRLSAVIEFMQANYMKPLTLADLAREARVSERRFGSIFKRAVGLSPHQFLIRLRMRAAASMLSGTDMSVSEVAAACGFYSLAHFSDAFARHFGRSPSRYRRAGPDHDARGAGYG
jgi:AraC family transcriptional regulator